MKKQLHLSCIFTPEIQRVYNEIQHKVAWLIWPFYNWMWDIWHTRGLSLIFLPRTNWKRHELEWWNFVFCWKSCWIIYLKEINTIQLWQSECCMNVRPVWTCHALTLFCIGRFSSNIISSIPTYSSQDLDAILCSLLNIQNRTVPLIQVLRKKGIIYDRESGHRSQCLPLNDLPTEIKEICTKVGLKRRKWLWTCYDFDNI